MPPLPARRAWRASSGPSFAVRTWTGPVVEMADGPGHSRGPPGRRVPPRGRPRGPRPAPSRRPGRGHPGAVFATGETRPSQTAETLEAWGIAAHADCARPLRDAAGLLGLAAGDVDPARGLGDRADRPPAPPRPGPAGLAGRRPARAGDRGLHDQVHARLPRQAAVAPRARPGPGGRGGGRLGPDAGQAGADDRRAALLHPAADRRAAALVRPGGRAPPGGRGAGHRRGRGLRARPAVGCPRRPFRRAGAGGPRAIGSGPGSGSRPRSTRWPARSPCRPRARHRARSGWPRSTRRPGRGPGTSSSPTSRRARSRHAMRSSRSWRSGPATSPTGSPGSGSGKRCSASCRPSARPTPA